MKFENSVVIDQPVKRVFDFVTDISNNPDWQTDILVLEVTSEGRFGLGSTYRCVNRFLGQRIETEVVITDYVPDRICAFRIYSGQVTGESSYYFEAKDGATKFTTKADIDFKFFRFGALLLRRKILRQMKHDMLKLKKILENDHCLSIALESCSAVR